MPKIRSYKELRVYQAAMDAAMKIFELSKTFPVEERYSLTDQIVSVHDQFAPTSVKLGANDVIQLTSSAR